MTSSLAPAVPFRDEFGRRALRSLLISCRLDIQTLRRHRMANDSRDDETELSFMDGQLRGLVRRLETATAVLDDLFEIVAPQEIGELWNREADLRINNSLRVISNLLENRRSERKA